MISYECKFVLVCLIPGISSIVG